ncbi:MAG: hypothetical protein ISR83_04105 [Candidatus Marinimicrobia bacterium]|nr:hypothetical protein [Candidatus Neomarinimicrobiota bacterium]
MKKFFILFSFISSFIIGQDVQFQVTHPRELPTLPDSMEIEEFQIIDRHLGWKELFTSVIYPGYNHEYILEDSTADKIKTIRLIASGLVVAAWADFTFFGKHELSSVSFQEMVQESPRDATAFSLGVAVNIFYTIYDWGKAQLLLKEKQSQIYYKYKK